MTTKDNDGYKYFSPCSAAVGECHAVARGFLANRRRLLHCHCEERSDESLGKEVISSQALFFAGIMPKTCGVIVRRNYPFKDPRGEDDAATP